jgi:DNA-binding response OmpR family regulator
MHVRTPVVMCTARDGEADIVEALRAGADDYVVKPLQRMELLARLEAVTRRRAVVDPSSEELVLDGVRVNFTARMIMRNDVRVELTAKGLTCRCCSCGMSDAFYPGDTFARAYGKVQLRSTLGVWILT